MKVPLEGKRGRGRAPSLYLGIGLSLISCCGAISSKRRFQCRRGQCSGRGGRFWTDSQWLGEGALVQWSGPWEHPNSIHYVMFLRQNLKQCFLKTWCLCSNARPFSLFAWYLFCSTNHPSPHHHLYAFTTCYSVSFYIVNSVINFCSAKDCVLCIFIYKKSNYLSGETTASSTNVDTP